MSKRVLIFCLLFAPLVPSARGALSYDTKLRIPATALTTTTSAASASYTCGANAEVLVVQVLYAGQTARTGNGPTYNGIVLTQAQSRQGVTETSVEMWYLLAPPVSQSLTVAVPNGNGVTMWVYVASGNAASGYTCALDSSGVNATTGSNPNVSVTTVAAGCLIFAVVATGDQTFAPTARTGTSLYEEDIAAYGGGGQYYVMSGTGAQSMSWSDATSDDYGAIAVAFKEVAEPIVRTINDSLGVTDARVLVKTVVRSFNESLGVTDAQVLVRAVVRSFDESLGVTEARDKVSEALRTLAEALGITDAQIASRGFIRVLEESLGLTDQMQGIEGGGGGEIQVKEYYITIE